MSAGIYRTLAKCLSGTESAELDRLSGTERGKQTRCFNFIFFVQLFSLNFHTELSHTQQKRKEAGSEISPVFDHVHINLCPRLFVFVYSVKSLIPVCLLLCVRQPARLFEHLCACVGHRLGLGEERGE